MRSDIAYTDYSIADFVLTVKSNTVGAGVDAAYPAIVSGQGTQVQSGGGVGINYKAVAIGRNRAGGRGRAGRQDERTHPVTGIHRVADQPGLGLPVRPQGNGGRTCRQQAQSQISQQLPPGGLFLPGRATILVLQGSHLRPRPLQFAP